MRNLPEKRFKKILNEKINRKSRKRDIASNTITKIFNAGDLLEKIHKRIKNKNLIQEARRQFIITLITSLEVFFKDYFIRLIETEKRFENFFEYYDKKFSVCDLDYISKKGISSKELISDYYNFQNLDNINKAFSTLLNIDFFKELEEYQWWFDKSDKKEGFFSIGKFYKELNKIINLRHDFVHDINFKRIINKREITDMYDFFLSFITITEFFIDDIFKLQKSNK